MTFLGARWGVHKGEDSDSVAASLVTARAQLDPLYSLQLTTGGHPDDPHFDNPEAFQKRLSDEQDRIHAKFRTLPHAPTTMPSQTVRRRN